MQKGVKLDFSRLLILSTTASLLSAAALIVYIILWLSHVSASFTIEKDLFVLGSMLGTFAEILELLLVVPLFKQAKGVRARVILGYGNDSCGAGPFVHNRSIIGMGEYRHRCFCRKTVLFLDPKGSFPVRICRSPHRYGQMALHRTNRCHTPG